MIEADSQTAGNGRDSRGRFAPGNPGGPGAPRGSRGQKLRHALLEALDEDDIQAVVGTLLGLARGGDVPAAKLVLAYAVGKPAQVEAGAHVSLDLPPIEALEDVAQAQRVVVQAAAAGSLGLEQAAALSGLLTAHGSALQALEVEQRIAALEQEARWR